MTIEYNPYGPLEDLSDEDLRAAYKAASQAEFGTRGLAQFWGTSHNSMYAALAVDIEKEMSKRGLSP